MKNKKGIAVWRKIDDLLSRLIVLLPDSFTGSSDQLKQKLRIIQGNEVVDDLIKEKKINTMRIYVLICMVFLLGLILHCGALLTTSALDTLPRPMWGTTGNSTKAIAHVSYEGQRVSREVTLRALPATLTKEEKGERLQKVKADLPNLILGENENLDVIQHPLLLNIEDREMGVKIIWDSDRPDVIDAEGKVNFICGLPGEQITLYAKLILEDQTAAAVIPIRLGEAAKGMYQKNLVDMLRERVHEMNKNNGGEAVILPSDLGHDVSVRWQLATPGNLPLLVIAAIIGVLLVHHQRYAETDREIRRMKASILRDLPELMNKLVLLLNAGLVVSRVMEKIAEDYQQYSHWEEGKKNPPDHHYLYHELYRIKERSQRTNTSMIKEFQAFAQRSGVRELIRLAAMLADNVNKGSALSEKLETESMLLWIGRKKRAEEKGKTVETKLVFPLALLLLVLIIITVAPALAEM